MNNYIYKPSNKIYVLSLILILGVFISCDDSEGGIGEDPYAGGKEPLGIKLTSQAPSPESAYPGDEVIFSAKGLLTWCDPVSNTYDFDFYISDEKVDIVTATDTTITIKVPDNVSSGLSYILLHGQVFYGPRFNVLGNIQVDKEYGLQKGTSDIIYDCIEHNTKAGNFYLIGAFDNIENVVRTKMAAIDNRGNILAQKSINYNVNMPFQQYIVQYPSSFSYFSDGQILLSGSFSQYEYAYANNKYTYSTVDNIAVLKNDISLDTMVVQVQPSKWSTETTKVASRFNGGTLQPIIKSFITSEDKVIAVGNISKYCQVDYEKSTAYDLVYNYEDVASIIRMERNGNLDKGFHYSNVSGANNISDAYMDEDDGVVIVGEFSTFDNRPAKGIVRIDANGNIDETFLSNIGSGVNDKITTVRYNRQLQKAVIAGNFTQFNGVSCYGLIVINKDGSIDNNFVPKEIIGGFVNFAIILSNGKIVISGTFTKYDGVSRPGFLIVDEDGSATQRFNVPGIFSGQLRQIVETKTTTGANGLLLTGLFDRFNGDKVSNVVMLEVDFD
jgi:hypothetical protein